VLYRRFFALFVGILDRMCLWAYRQVPNADMTGDMFCCHSTLVIISKNFSVGLFTGNWICAMINVLNRSTDTLSCLVPTKGSFACGRGDLVCYHLSLFEANVSTNSTKETFVVSMWASGSSNGCICQFFVLSAP